MKLVFIIEIKSSGSHFMTSIKGQNFQHNGLAPTVLVHYPQEVLSFYRGHKVLTLGLYFYNRFLVI